MDIQQFLINMLIVLLGVSIFLFPFLYYAILIAGRVLKEYLSSPILREVWSWKEIKEEFLEDFTTIFEYSPLTAALTKWAMIVGITGTVFALLDSIFTI